MHVALEELHEPSLPQHREGVLDEVHTIQSAISLLSQREYDDLQTRAHDFVGARQIANPDGLRGRVLRTGGGGPHYRKPSDRVKSKIIQLHFLNGTLLPKLRSNKYFNFLIYRSTNVLVYPINFYYLNSSRNN